MKKNKLPLCFLLIIAFFSCKQSNSSNNKEIKSNEVQVKKDTYPNGRIKREERFRKDSSGNYVRLDYKVYYESGRLKSIAFAKNGVQDSVSMSYFPSGILSDSLYISKGRHLGLQYTYYNNGTPRKIIDCVDNTQMFCEVVYNSSGEMQIVGGHLMTVFLGKKNEIKVNQVEKIGNRITVLPNIITVLRLKVSDSQNRIITDTTINKFKNEHNAFFYDYEHSFDKPGAYKYKISLLVTDSATGKILDKEAEEYILDVEQ